MLAQRRVQIEEALETVLATAQQAIRSWARDQQSTVDIWASDQALVLLTEQLLDLPTTQQALSNAPAQEGVADRLRPVQEAFEYMGYFIIGPGNINLASSSSSNIAVVNILEGHGDALDRMWDGEPTISPPQRSDVPLPDSVGTMQVGRPTMFVGAPIRDREDTVIALLAFRLDPTRDFTAILQRGRIGRSGETYAFDRAGRLISDSRFNEQLRRIGLVPEEATAILNIEVRDPGANLVEGESGRGEYPLTEMAASATAGNAGRSARGYRDYRGVTVTGAWLWDDDLGFGMTSEQDYEEAWRSAVGARRIILLLGSSSALLLLVLTSLFNTSRDRAVKASEARLAAEELGESEARLRAVLDTAVDAIVTIDEVGVIQSANPATEELFGYRSDELVGDNVSILMQSPDRERHDGYIARYRETGAGTTR